jgi:hypothetical protein
VRNLLDGLPPEARTRRKDPDEPMWGFAEELLAQIVEEVSLLVSNRTRKKPREIPRPSDRSEDDHPRARNSLFAAALSKSGRVRFRGN